MEEKRERVRLAIESLDLAESWLFEYSASAAGIGPSDQYLQSARDSDVFVLLVGDEVRDGTRREYDVAYDDNPSKVLAFFVGQGGHDVRALRDQIRARHTTIPVATVDLLPGAVADAVRRYVESGDIVRPGLTERVTATRTARRDSLGLPAGFEWERSLIRSSQLPSGLLDGEAHTFLIGEAGSGKTDAALGALSHIANGRPPRLPLLLQARPEALSVESLIDDALMAVRFTAGDTLIRQYLADGRVALVIDGIDELDPDLADELMRSVVDAADRYPRTAMLLVRRSLDGGPPTGWAQAELAPLGPNELNSLFSAFGYQEEHQAQSLPRDLMDLVRLPFWAILVAQFGRVAKSGLSLLEALCESRITEGLVGNPMRQQILRDGIGALALGTLPAADASLDQALSDLSGWLERPDTRQRYESRTAESVIDDARQAGLVSIDLQRVKFVHPLVATFLAARAVALSGQLDSAPAQTPDFAAMAAALMAEDRHDDAVALLKDGGIFAASKAVRLSGQRSGSVRDDDLVLFDAIYRSLAESLVGQSIDGAWQRIALDGYHCLRIGAETEAQQAEIVDLRDWGWTVGGEADYYCWPEDPFVERTPLLLAATLIVIAFKQRLIDVRPTGDPYGPMGKTSDDHLPLTEAKSQAVIEHVVAQGRARSDLLDAIGLRGSVLDTTVGSPTVTIYSDSHGTWYSAEWGGDAPSVRESDDEPTHARSVGELKADPAAVAYRELVSDVEARLGSQLSTLAVRHPSEFDWAI